VLWRVRYVGDEKTEDAWVSETFAQPSGQDRWGRFRARTDAELAGLDAVKALLKKDTPLEQLNGVIALARVGREEHREEAFAVLDTLTWAQLSRHEKLTWLRAVGLVTIRLGDATPEEREMILGKIDASFPHQDLILDAELCRILCRLQAPHIVARTLARMAEPKEAEVPDWARLIERNSNYGAEVAKVLRQLGSPRDVHYAYCLRAVPGPWKKEQRRQLMDWYVRNEAGKAQKSARLGLKLMREDTIALATEEERELIASWGLEVKKDPFADLPQPKGPARTWSVAEMTEVAADLATGDRENGKEMFQGCLCAACHRVGVEGGAAGPDLTTVGGRFSAEELAVAILEPSREVSDQYAFQKITLSDGNILYGRIIDEKDEILVVATNAFDFGQTREVSRADIATIELSPISPMPAALVNQLNEQEMRDLLAYLLEKPQTKE